MLSLLLNQLKNIVMRKLVLLSTLVLFAFIANSQTIIFEDDFESYTAGETLASQTSDWTTWSGGTTGGEASLVSTTQANSGVNSLNVIAGNDMIYDFGNKTSGVYQVEFEYLVAAGAEAYFNIEHAFGSEWAFSMTYASGTATLANGATPSLTIAYADDTWVNYLIDIDLGNDLITITIDDVEFASWVFSTTEEGAAGMNQLGCINFYGPANNNFFVDDFVYTEIESGLAPATINISTATIASTSGLDEIVPFTNDGEEVLNFSAYPTFNEPTLVTKATKDGVLNVDGDNTGNAVGWASEITAFVATRFAPEIVRPFIGQEITTLEIYIGDLPENDEITVYVWEKGEYMLPGAGTILSQKTVTVTTASWNTITLDAPILLSGDEIWVGYQMTALLDTYVVGMDDVANIPATNYIKAGPVWSEFDGVGGNGNFSIRANVVGAGWAEWMSVTPATGTVAAAASQDITIDFVTDGLADGEYTGHLVVGCNDPVQEWTQIPVTLSYVVGIDGINNVSIMTYPNPVTDNYTIKSETNINSIEITNIAGQMIRKYDVNSTSFNVDFSNIKGVYFVKINTENGEVIRRVISE